MEQSLLQSLIVIAASAKRISQSLAVFGIAVHFARVVVGFVRDTARPNNLTTSSTPSSEHLSDLDPTDILLVLADRIALAQNTTKAYLLTLDHGLVRDAAY